MAKDAPLYQNVPTEPQYGETQEIEAQEQAAPVAEEKAATVTQVPLAPITQATEQQPAPEEVAPEETETIAINPGTATFPPLGDNYEAVSYNLSNEKMLAIALLGRPSITMMTRRLAMALMEEVGGLDNTESVPVPNAYDAETLGQEPELIAQMAQETSPEGET